MYSTKKSHTASNKMFNSQKNFMQTGNGTGADAITANPTQSGHILKLTAKVADVFQNLMSKWPQKQAQWINSVICVCK